MDSRKRSWIIIVRWTEQKTCGPTPGVKRLHLELRVEAIHLVPRYAAGTLGIAILLQQLVAADLAERMIPKNVHDE